MKIKFIFIVLFVFMLYSCKDLINTEQKDPGNQSTGAGNQSTGAGNQSTGSGTGGGTGTGTGTGSNTGTGSGTGGGTGAGTGTGSIQNPKVKLNLLTTSQDLGDDVDIDGFSGDDLTGATIALLVSDKNLDPENFNGDITSLNTVLGWAGSFTGGDLKIEADSKKFLINDFLNGLGLELNFPNYGNIINSQITFRLFTTLANDILYEILPIDETMTNEDFKDIKEPARPIISNLKLFNAGSVNSIYDNLYIITGKKTDALAISPGFTVDHFNISDYKIFKLDGSLQITGMNPPPERVITPKVQVDDPKVEIPKVTATVANLLTTNQDLGGDVDIDGFSGDDLTGATIALLVSDSDLDLENFNGDIKNIDTVLGWAGAFMDDNFNSNFPSPYIPFSSFFDKVVKTTLTPGNYGSITSSQITFRLFNALSDDILNLIGDNTNALAIAISNLPFFNTANSTEDYSDLYIIIGSAPDVFVLMNVVGNPIDGNYNLGKFTITDAKVFKVNADLTIN